MQASRPAGGISQPFVLRQGRVSIRSALPLVGGQRLCLTAVKSGVSGYGVTAAPESADGTGQTWDMEHLAWNPFSGEAEWSTVWGFRFSQVLDGVRLAVTWKRQGNLWSWSPARPRRTTPGSCSR